MDLHMYQLWSYIEGFFKGTSLYCGSFNLSLKKPIYAGERILERAFPHVSTLRERFTSYVAVPLLQKYNVNLIKQKKRNILIFAFIC